MNKFNMIKLGKNKFVEYFLLISIILMHLLIIRYFLDYGCNLYPCIYPINSRISLDQLYYIMMSDDPTNVLIGAIAAPYCYRVLTPFIAWLLPFNLEINFQIITYTSFFFTGIILYEIFKEKFNKIFGLIGISLFYSLRLTARLYFFDIWATDPLAFFFLVLCFWAINKSNLKVYAISLCLGVLAKEIILYTIPVFVISQFLTIGKTKFYQKNYLLRNFLTIIPSIAIFFILRLIFKPSLAHYPNYIELFLKISAYRFALVLNGDISIIYECTVGTWGLLILIYLFFCRKSLIFPWLKLYGIFMVLIYFQIFIAYSVARLLTAGFYPMILLSLSGINRLCEKRFKYELIFLGISIIYFLSIIVINYVLAIDILFMR